MAKRRIPAADFWTISDAIEAAKKAGVEWEKWRKNYVKENELYLDDVDFVSGAISKLQDDNSRKQVGHAPQDDISGMWEEVAKLAEMNFDIQHKIDVIAKKYGVRPDMINTKTGEVAESDFEIMKEVSGEAVDAVDDPAKLPGEEAK